MLPTVGDRIRSRLPGRVRPLIVKGLLKKAKNIDRTLVDHTRFCPFPSLPKKFENCPSYRELRFSLESENALKRAKMENFASGR